MKTKWYWKNIVKGFLFWCISVVMFFVIINFIPGIDLSIVFIIGILYGCCIVLIILNTWKLWDFE